MSATETAITLPADGNHLDIKDTKSSAISRDNVGKLVRVPLREIWKHEAFNFSRWLQDNIDVLNEALGLNLVSVDTERPTGDFSVDLVAEDERGNAVIIENQLEKSNHDHLGKLLTYFVGVDARVAIWIVSEPRPEHVAALNWLNESNSGFFYMVKLEGVRIGDSLAAPLFTLIVGPSEETKEAGQTKKEIAECHIFQKRWWSSLIERSKIVSRMHAHVTPGEYSWIGVSAGIRGLNFNYTVRQKTCSVEFSIDRGKESVEENKHIFDELYSHREEIETTFGQALTWNRGDEQRSCSIKFVFEEGGYKSPEEDWPDLQDNIIHAMSKLEQALRPYLKQLKVSSQ